MINSITLEKYITVCCDSVHIHRAFSFAEFLGDKTISTSALVVWSEEEITLPWICSKEIL